MGKTTINWATDVWNPVTGCKPISPGCQNCYAKRMSKRLAGRCGYPKDDPFKVTLHPDKLDLPLQWKKPRRIFVNSMSDLFHDDVPDLDIISIFSIMAMCPQHTFLILTKRPERMLDIVGHETVAADVWVQTTRGVSDEPLEWPLPNVWLGVSVENQSTADDRLPALMLTPAALRFVSVEPMLGPVNLNKWLWKVVQWAEAGGPNMCTDMLQVFPAFFVSLDWIGS